MSTRTKTVRIAIAAAIVIALALWFRSRRSSTPAEPTPDGVTSGGAATGSASAQQQPIADPSALVGLPTDKGVTPELAELDKQFEDQAKGAGWSRICVMHYSRDRLAYGKAACERGLAMSPEGAVRGELLYAMGLIEERGGHRDLAAIYFERAYAVAPGSGKAVEGQLAELSGNKPPTPATAAPCATSPSGAPIMIPSRLRAH